MMNHGQMSMRRLFALTVTAVALAAAGTPDATAAAPIDTRLIYTQSTDNTHQLATADPDGTDVRIMPGSVGFSFPTWSPDGTRFAFSGYDGDDGEIFVATADGELLSQVTHNDVNDQNPFWSPSGNRLGFWRGEDFPYLYTAKATGGDEQRLIRIRRDYHPRWSPDGKWISYDRYNEDINKSIIYVIRADGSDLTPRQVTGDEWSSREATWSPDGTSIAVVRDRYYDGYWRSELWKLALDGTSETLLTTGLRSIDQPAWSPAGDRIAFVRGADIWTITPDATDLVRVTDTNRYEGYVDWGIVPHCTSRGTSGNDVLTGSTGDDVICGFGGSDRIEATAGNDVILGGPGTDKIDYREADHRVVTDLRVQRATSGGHDSRLYGVEGVLGSPLNDEMFGGDFRNVLNGYGGDDALIGRGGDDTLNGGAGNDVLRPGLGGDDVNGGPDRDTASFIDANGRVRVNLRSGIGFGQGDDIILDIEKVVGSPFDDFIVGTDGANVLRGGDGEDILDGMEGPDDLFGGDDRDFLYGRAGTDDLFGDGGRDYIDGGDDDDDCYSGSRTTSC